MSQPPTTMRFKHLGGHIGIAAEKGGEVQWSKSFTAEEMDGLIHTLGRFRAGLPEAVNPEIDPNARVEATPQPAIAMRDQGEEGFEILIRHPGYGWLSFLLSDQACEAIAAAMLNRKGA